MKGTPKTMQTMTSTYQHSYNVASISQSLKMRVNRALYGKSHLYRWNIIIDPGIGFAKTVNQNFQLLTHLRQLSNLPGEDSAGSWGLESNKGNSGSVAAVGGGESTAALVLSTTQPLFELVFLSLDAFLMFHLHRLIPKCLHQCHDLETCEDRLQREQNVPIDYVS
jgi:hypothetical protein